MELIRKNQIQVFANSGIESQQLLFPENSKSSRVTITRVTVASGATNPPHRHEWSEQIWVALSGEGTLILDDDRTIDLHEGDVVRFAEGDLHGLVNLGVVEFVYLSVTSPPQNFRGAYEREWKSQDGDSQ